MSNPSARLFNMHTSFSIPFARTASFVGRSHQEHRLEDLCVGLSQTRKLTTKPSYQDHGQSSPSSIRVKCDIILIMVIYSLTDNRSAEKTVPMVVEAKISQGDASMTPNAEEAVCNAEDGRSEPDQRIDTSPQFSGLSVCIRLSNSPQFER